MFQLRAICPGEGENPRVSWAQWLASVCYAVPAEDFKQFQKETFEVGMKWLPQSAVPPPAVPMPTPTVLQMPPAPTLLPGNFTQMLSGQAPTGFSPQKAYQSAGAPGQWMPPQPGPSSYGTQQPATSYGTQQPQPQPGTYGQQPGYGGDQQPYTVSFISNLH